MEYLIIYLFVSIEKIAAFLALGGSVFWWSIVAFVGTYVLALLGSKCPTSLKENVDKLAKYRKTAVVFTCIGALLYSVSVLLPNKKELAVIIAAGATYNVLTSDSAKEIGGKAVELLKKEIDKALADDVINSLPDKAKEKAVDAVKEAVNA